MWESFLEFAYRLGIYFTQAVHFILYRIAKLIDTFIIVPVAHIFFGKADLRLFNKWDPNCQNVAKYKPRPWDLVVNSKEIYSRIFGYQILGVGETYMEGLWDAEDLEDVFYRTSLHDLQHYFYNPFVRFLDWFKFYFINLQINQRAWQVGLEHYDIGNNFYTKMLDKNMNYSCGYFKNTTTDNLEQAQIDKMELIAQKLKLKPGMKVLDVGCGWGGLAKYLAEKHHVSVIGCTVSKEGGTWGQEFCKGLDCDIRVADYRDIPETGFDRATIVGCIEHFGHKNYRKFFEIVHSKLKPEGLFLVHTIGVHHTTMPCCDPWVEKYVFNNGVLPRPSHMVDAMDGLFILEDWHNFGHDYHLTLMNWFRNFDKNWPEMQKQFKYPEVFYRRWKFYLLFCAGLFRSRRTQLWQIVMSKGGVIGGYDSVR